MLAIITVTFVNPPAEGSLSCPENKYPYFKSIASACFSKTRSVKRSENDGYHLIYQRI